MSDNHARDQAKAQLSSIRKMVKALKVGYDRLKELNEEEIWRTASEWEKYGEELHQLIEDANECESYDDAQQVIMEDPLSVEVRTGWFSPSGVESFVEPEEFRILLCTGGPAVQIIGDLDDHMQPLSAYIQYQDWGTPWTNYPLDDEEKEDVLTYCRQFYYGG